jgi:hypothetical protein
MDDKKVAQLEALISGLLVVQQVTLNALIRNNAIGYPQLREALKEALEQVEKPGVVAHAAAVTPLRKALHSIDILNAPHGRDAPTTAPDWSRAMRDAQSLT